MYSLYINGPTEFQVDVIIDYLVLHLKNNEYFNLIS